MAMTPADVVIVGQALETFGFEANNTISALGLITLGFLWPCDAIWQPSDDAYLTTIWVAASLPTYNTEVCVDDNGGLG